MMKRIVRGLALAVLTACFISATRLSAADMNAAAQNYSDSCTGCHGASGHGDGKDAATLKTKPGDFANCPRMAKFSDEQLFKIIKDGGPAGGESADMSSWSKGYDDDEIRDLVAYVRQFCRK